MAGRVPSSPPPPPPPVLCQSRGGGIRREREREGGRERRKKAPKESWLGGTLFHSVVVAMLMVGGVWRYTGLQGVRSEEKGDGEK